MAEARTHDKTNADKREPYPYDPPVEQWHISKSIPVALIMGFLAQTVTVVWFASSLNNQTAQNSKDIVELRAHAKSSSDDERKILVTLGQLDERSQAVSRAMEELRRMITSNMRYGSNNQNQPNMGNP